MKKLFLFLTIVLSSSIAIGQTTISAEEILKEIDSGKNISYNNISIKGDLDLTTLKNNADKKGGSFFNMDDEKVVITINQDIKFENCEFNGRVIGYVNDDEDDILYSTRFKGKVTIKNCTFNKGLTFKYSSFYDVVTITDSKFEDDVEFKYANFDTNADFTGSSFYQGCNFKYANFEAKVSFNGVLIKNEALFKYTNFEDDVRFVKSRFKGLANFKYTNFDGRISFENSLFDDYADFKYTNFSSGVSFKNVTMEDVDFKYTNFSSPLILTNLTINGSVDYKYANGTGGAFD
ncbi:MAG: pentapeptide repeat-containing protein [Flavobacteriales bacterium]|nr:pentapeptide repeat-containing protein [Flavobacteriales bacterium]